MAEPTHLRHELIAARNDRGWIQAVAAERVGVAESTWQRWEHGKVTPHLPQMVRVAEAFEVPLERVRSWFAHSAPAEERTEPADVTRPAVEHLDAVHDDLSVPWLRARVSHSVLADTVEVASELWRWDVDPSRRALLSSLPFVPAALREWVASITLDPGPNSRGHTGTSGRAVGIEDVHRMHDAIDAFVDMDHRYGGKLTRPAIVHFLDTEAAPLLNGRYTDEVGSQLMSAAAAMTALAGWSAYDLAEHGLAQSHYGQALALAKAADNPLTSAWVLATASQQAIDLQQPELAIRLARAAQLAGQDVASPRVRAVLLLREARASAVEVELAETPDHNAIARVERLLGAAEDAFAAVTSDDDDPRWAHDLTHAELMAEAGCVWRMIGRHQRAADHAQTALDDFDSTFVRSRQFNMIHRGQALLGLGELDAALTTTRQALPLSINQRSARSVALVRSFNEQLNEYAGDPDVEDWRDQLRVALPIAV